MSGHSPSHLLRRGAVYWVRFRIPADLKTGLEMGELSRSLRTKEAKEARARCLAATVWFKTIVVKLRSMPSPTRADLQASAATYFAQLAAEIDIPRQFDQDNFTDELRWNIECSRNRISELDVQLARNMFDTKVRSMAAEIARAVGASFGDLDEREQLFASQLAARAEREQMQLLIHQLSSPHRRYASEDALFSTGTTSNYIPAGEHDLRDEQKPISLREAVASYLERMRIRNLSQSQVDEVARALDWLRERFGDKRPAAAISKSELRTFRDDLARLDVRLRGRSLPFEKRLTSAREHQVKSVTSVRYWRSVQSFFEWCTAEQFVEVDPSAGLKLDARKGELKRTPPPFTSEELKELFRTPLYTGYLSPKRVLTEGSCHRREGHWWSGVLLMFTGLRAGELSQLLPEDFCFDDEVPHLKVRQLDDQGRKTKSTKNEASIRDVPLAPPLIELGLAEFVQARAAITRRGRVFKEFRLGTKGRTSDGLTKFWSSYLRKFDLWKEGRSTHVWRHTVVACLRDNGVAEEDIAAFVGHATGTMTSRYGGAYPLSRKMRTATHLDYGFDVVAAAGGPFAKSKHE